MIVPENYFPLFFLLILPFKSNKNQILDGAGLGYSKRNLDLFSPNTPEGQQPTISQRSHSPKTKRKLIRERRASRNNIFFCGIFSTAKQGEVRPLEETAEPCPFSAQNRFYSLNTIFQPKFPSIPSLGSSFGFRLWIQAGFSVFTNL